MDPTAAEQEFLADGVKQVGFAAARTAMDEQRIEAHRVRTGQRPGGSAGDLVGLAERRANFVERGRQVLQRLAQIGPHLRIVEDLIEVLHRHAELVDAVPDRLEGLADGTVGGARNHGALDDDRVTARLAAHGRPDLFPRADVPETGGAIVARGRIHAMRRAVRICVADARLNVTVGDIVQNRRRKKVHCRFGLRQIDVLALAGACAVKGCRSGVRRSHLINVTLGGLGLIAIPYMPNENWLMVPMIGVGFAWA